MNQLHAIEQNGLRVLTTQQLAESYGADIKIISNNFNRNKERYKLGKHFLLLEGDGLKQFKAIHQNDEQLKYSTKLYLWTEKGAWLHAKSLNTDEAWDAYEMLVDVYYTVKQQVKVLSEREKLMASMKLSLETAEELTQVKGEIKEVRLMVEHQITLDSGEQRRVQKAVGHKVYELSVHNHIRSALFRELYSDIKDRFGVASYKDIKRRELRTALRYIEAWIPKKVVS